MNETNEQILIMAYTNRAVDEICESLESIRKDIQYIRIGSRYGTRKDFHQKLYNVITAGISNRESILHFLHKTRIYVGTVASLHGKKELFALKKFDTLIIDEASQILESNLVGILSRFKRFIMIGDHLQLPAVSAQASEDSYITHTELNEMGIQNLTDSLFERLYRTCVKNSWKHAYGILRKQGRMHVDLMKFPSEHFYNDALEIVDSKKNSRQTLSLSSKFKKLSSHSLDAILSTERTIFIPVHSKNELQHSKSNVKEAEVVTEVLQRLSELYTLNQLEWNESTCGIVTPFKIQISTISALIEDKNLGGLAVSVDTVERYQGSARDIIIISTCVNSISQLEQITSVNSEGTDRKLNVALTRAKEQIILIGNEEVLRNSSIYSKLIDSYHRLEVINI
jgi:DNA replication ATP-dependent helicase Dna2